MQQTQENRHGLCFTRPPKRCGLNIEAAAAQVHQRAFLVKTSEGRRYVYHPLALHAFRLDALPQQEILGESIFIFPRWPFRRDGRRPPSFQPTQVFRPSGRTSCNCRRIYIAGSDCQSQTMAQPSSLALKHESQQSGQTLPGASSCE